MSGSGTAGASRFLFDRDFRNPAPDAKATAAAQAAEERGYARGFAEGRRQAEGEAAARLAAATSRLAEGAGVLLRDQDAERAELEAEALALAQALALKLAGDALRREPLAAIAEAARAAFPHLRGVPHLAVRVNESLVEDVDALVRRLAREGAFEGRVVTLGEPDILPGDARLEWADGGVVRDAAAVERAAANALRPACPPST